MGLLAHTAGGRSVLGTSFDDSRPTIVIEALPEASADQRLLLQVWINLLDNAVKYSSKVG